MIHTSYYGKYRGNAGCCISIMHPKGFKGFSCEALYPSRSLLEWYKFKSNELDTWYAETKDAEEFIKRRKVIELQYEQSYYEDVLSRLDPKSVAKNLDGKVLLCYEKSGRFCHRHIVAKWLINNGYKCEELV